MFPYLLGRHGEGSNVTTILDPTEMVVLAFSLGQEREEDGGIEGREGKRKKMEKLRGVVVVSIVVQSWRRVWSIAK